VVPTDQPPAEVTPAPEGVYVVPVTVDVQGSAEAVIRFSELIQLDTRLFLMQSFALTPDAGDSTISGYLFVVVDPLSSIAETPEQ